MIVSSMETVFFCELVFDFVAMEFAFHAVSFAPNWKLVIYHVSIGLVNFYHANEFDVFREIDDGYEMIDYVYEFVNGYVNGLIWRTTMKIGNAIFLV